ncbi:hypothetical protein SAMN05216249_107138 [Acetitomaculum ruminis DSM 5522]|uniref:Uncharacterized protein n=1 Tax=Acetitomaculum ruminis DSM 5522 TaxID=1120918 RepID=A0A1I0XW50_9FIRM|nr:hypothetical protein [Acetitomaculum ruminis]SFB04183.1 hypothetical protein SAMN05216249_107138 [Acetitomaculum ruminis DSM 5522]
MGIFDFFKRNGDKEKIKKDLIEVLPEVFEEETEEKVVEEIDLSDENSKKKWYRSRFENWGQLEHYILGQCENVHETIDSVENCKNEYDDLTAKIKDIQIIEKMPPDDKKEITELVQEIMQVSDDRNKYHQYSKKLSDASFDRIRLYEDDFPKAIKRLMSSETYQSTIKKDMDRLEGEKGLLLTKIEDYGNELKILKYLAISVPIVLFASFGLIFFIKETFHIRSELTLAYFIAAFICVGIGAFVFLRGQIDTANLKRCNENLNYVIIALNHIKVKYVNETNAVDYAYKKFAVHSSHELEYLWNEYNNTREQKEQFIRSTDDLEFFNKTLNQKLSKYLKYPGIWESQSMALIDSTLLLSIKELLDERRKKLKAQMSMGIDEMNKTKNEIRDLAKAFPEYRLKILELIKAIDT